MIQPTLFRIPGNFSLILFCVVLGACASTQRSSTGLGEQAAAPIADASAPQGGAKPGNAAGSPSAAGTSGNSSSSPSKPAGAAGTAGAAGGTAAKQGSAESGAATADNEEAAQLKRQLADQDAQINKLRADQEAEAAREDAQAEKMREQQAAAAAGGSDQQSAGGAASAAKSGSQDEAAVFPANASTTDAGSVESAVQRAAERSVYFNYDQATVPEKYDDMLLANAAWLRAHPDVKSEVQGNCDERGSREYNLALGARRAMAVKRALELAGADGSRISAISYGAEKPVATGKDEESYSQNRRADIVY